MCIISSFILSLYHQTTKTTKTMKTPKKPHSDRNQGRKKKNGRRVQFLASPEVWEVLESKKSKTAFIEESVLKWDKHTKAIDKLLNEE